jgi:hypothetical protein
VLAQNIELIEQRLEDSDRVLDVGGWHKPLARADWVIDLMPHGTRGEAVGAGEERFTAETWVERDICEHTRWPFDDEQFDFVVCSHTLEDVRDPIAVCAELRRVAKAGYIEVPSRLQEQAWGVNGEFAGWSHHHWLIDIDDDAIEFVFKPHSIHGHRPYHFPAPLGETLTEEERVETLFWEGTFEFRERIFYELDDFDAYMADFVRTRQSGLEARVPRASMLKRLRRAAVRISAPRA